MSTQVNILLLSLGAIQGLFLSLLLFKKRGSLQGSPFLAAYLFVMALQIVLKVMSKAWLWNNMRTFYEFSYQLPLLYGPLIYLFVRHATGQQPGRIRGIIHFVPAS